MEPGDIVNIYHTPQLELGFEGQAKLIELVDEGHSFILYNEKLFTKLEDRAIGENGSHLPLTKEQENNNKIYANMILYFEGSKGSLVNPEIKIFREELKSLIGKTEKHIKKMHSLILSYRFQWSRLNLHKSFIFQYCNDEIIRFIYQRYYKNWTHTLYREQKWIIEFVGDQYSIESKSCMFNNPFRTVRKIRNLLCICPDEDTQNCEMVYYTTNSKGYSAYDKKIKRNKKKDKVQQEEKYENLPLR
jgi:hypothetical protein